MKKYVFALLAMAAALAITPAALADDIGVASNGTVTFSAAGPTGGTGTVETGPSTNGVFTSLIGDAATLYAWGPASTGVEAFSTDGGLVTFTIGSVGLFEEGSFGSAAFLIAGGSGVIDDNGTWYDVNWTASGNTTDGVTYSFGVNDSTVTPEPSSLLLLGTGLLGLAIGLFRTGLLSHT